MSYRTVQKGDRVSEYILAEKLGRGGFGEVWKAEHAQLRGKFVAIKIPTSPEAMDCLKQEAVFQHELDHPNIVRTIGLNTQNDPPYFMMEYVEGKNLRQLMLDDGILPPPYAIDIAVQVCEALSFAHSKGIVHKDIKPENILVEKKKVDVSNKGKALLHYVKLTDMGLGMVPGARQSEIQLSEGARTSGVRILSGTLFYMAPEQMLPDRQVDSRSDVYSLGVVLYEMLTGELPLGMDLPGELNPVVTPELDAICKRALCIDRDDRYASAREMAADLQKAKEALLLKLVSSGAPALEPTPRGGFRRLTPHTVPLAGAAVEVIALKRRRWAPVLEWGLLAFVVALLAVAGYAFMKLNDGEPDGRMSATVRSAPADAVLGGPLLIDSFPKGAEVWFDDQRVGNAPVRLENVKFQTHTLELRREFHATKDLELEPRQAADGARTFRVLEQGAPASEATLFSCEDGCDLGRIELSRLKGRVEITTPQAGLAEVRINGEFYGPTPFSKEVDAGMHHFTIVKEGYKELSVWLRVEGDGTLTREFPLLKLGTVETAERPSTFDVQLVSSPAGASIIVDGEELGKTPCTLKLATGNFKIRILKKYFVPRTVTLAVNGPAKDAYTLTPVRSAVEFDSDPPGAEVFVNGNRVGVTPVRADSVPGGAHKARFILEGHYEQTLPFEILNGDPMDRPIRATLQRIPPGRIVVECDVPGIEAFLDGETLGRLPVASRSVPGGRHRVRVLGVERQVIVAAGVETRVTFTPKDLDLVLVPEGDFSYGTADPKPGEVYVRSESTGAFYIDRYEVTNGQYAPFLKYVKETNDHRLCHPAEKREDPRNHEPTFWNDPAFNHARQPVVGVNWFDAYAYAAWAGKRLPKEREWEKAARGNKRWTYPWGNDWHPREKRCNWGDFGGIHDGYKVTAPVGKCPGTSPYGCYDMVGNVREWCIDDYTMKNPAARDQVLVVGKVVRGGDYLRKRWTTTVSREYEDPLNLSPTIGFRCVVDEKK